MNWPCYDDDNVKGEHRWEPYLTFPIPNDTADDRAPKSICNRCGIILKSNDPRLDGTAGR